MSPGLRPPGPRSTNVCRCCTSVIRIAPGFVYANAPGRPHAAAHTTATTPAVFALFELIKPVPPSSLDAGLLPMPAVKRRSWETPEMEELELLDWKRRVFSLYAEVRSAPEPALAWRVWRAARDELFRTHPQSPVPRDEQAAFERLPYFDYDPALRVLAEVEPAEEARVLIAGSGPEHAERDKASPSPCPFRRFASAVFELGGDQRRLALYWLEAYGGGVFLPFRDETSGRETYG